MIKILYILLLTSSIYAFGSRSTNFISQNAGTYIEVFYQASNNLDVKGEKLLPQVS
jgi:hypothetical protein